MALPENATDAEKLLKLSEDREEAVRLLDALYEKWEALEEDLS